jgi:hypothetical protein
MRLARSPEVVHQVIEGLMPERLAFRVDSKANSIAWLVWHLTRIQDDHLADAAQAEQVWTSQGWVERFGLPFDPRDTGYGHRADEVAAVQVESAELLVGYHDAVHQQTIRYVERLEDADLDRWSAARLMGWRVASGFLLAQARLGTKPRRRRRRGPAWRLPGEPADHARCSFEDVAGASASQVIAPTDGEIAGSGRSPL